MSADHHDRGCFHRRHRMLCPMTVDDDDDGDWEASTAWVDYATVASSAKCLG